MITYQHIQFTFQATKTKTQNFSALTFISVFLLFSGKISVTEEVKDLAMTMELKLSTQKLTTIANLMRGECKGGTIWVISLNI